MEGISRNSKALLVGDNPFHNISHLSQDRSRLREKTISLPERAADLILKAVDCGANGFMFSVSTTTLAILKTLRKRRKMEGLNLYPIVPYAYEYVKLSTQVGGIPGLTKMVAKRIILSLNLKAIATGLIGYLNSDPESLLKTYVTYEMSRVRAAAGKRATVDGLILHEVITDLALAMNLKSIFKSYVNCVQGAGIVPGFNTVNFPFLVDKFEQWNMNLDQSVVASPFNRIGFQMSPSKEKCEKALESLSEPVLIAISILAAGYLKTSDAIQYVAALPNVKGVAVGVSRDSQAQETFKLLADAFSVRKDQSKKH